MIPLKPGVCLCVFILHLVYMHVYTSQSNVYDITVGQYPWPSLADVNTRARRYVSTWVKHQKREELKQAHLVKVSFN